MSDFFEDMDRVDREKENVQMKTGEISGKQHLFHSLPKEFQQWHTNNYLLEKEGNLDSNLITKALLNAYSWKIILNASWYSMFSFLLLLTALITIRHYEMDLLTILVFIGYIITAVYISYQFYFFGIIRAQIIGPITKKTADHTSYLYYSTYTLTYGSLIVMIVFVLSFIKSFLELIFSAIVVLKYSSHGHMDMATHFFYNLLIEIHNIISKLVFSTNSSSLIYNPYVLISLFVIIQVVLIFLVERSGYKAQRGEIIESMSKHKLETGFPIEKAQKVISSWRKKHGM